MQAARVACVNDGCKASFSPLLSKRHQVRAHGHNTTPSIDATPPLPHDDPPQAV
jgi:hypothetical protein